MQHVKQTCIHIIYICVYGGNDEKLSAHLLIYDNVSSLQIIAVRKTFEYTLLISFCPRYIQVACSLIETDAFLKGLIYTRLYYATGISYLHIKNTPILLSWYIIYNTIDRSALRLNVWEGANIIFRSFNNIKKVFFSTI